MRRAGFSLRRELALGLGVYGLYLLVRRLVLRRRWARARTRERRAHRRVREAARARRRARRAAGASPLPATRPRPQPRLRALQRHAHRRLARPALPAPRRGLSPLPARLPARACRARSRLPPLPTAPPRVLDGFVDTLVRGQRARPRAPAPRALLQPGRCDAEPARRIRGRHGRRDRGAERLARREGGAHAYAPLVATVVAGTGNHYVLDAVGRAPPSEPPRVGSHERGPVPLLVFSASAIPALAALVLLPHAGRPARTSSRRAVRNMRRRAAPRSWPSRRWSSWRLPAPRTNREPRTRDHDDGSTMPVADTPWRYTIVVEGPRREAAPGEGEAPDPRRHARRRMLEAEPR